MLSLAVVHILEANSYHDYVIYDFIKLSQEKILKKVIYDNYELIMLFLLLIPN